MSSGGRTAVHMVELYNTSKLCYGKKKIIGKGNGHDLVLR